MALTTAEQAELDAARAALTKIRSGGAVKSVQAGNRRVENAAPDPAGLERRIAELEGRSTGCRRRGAVSFRL